MLVLALRKQPLRLRLLGVRVWVRVVIRVRVRVRDLG